MMAVTDTDVFRWNIDPGSVREREASIPSGGFYRQFVILA